MIARVRIAPVEQWCEKARRFAEINPGFLKLVGGAVTIIPGSARKNKSGCSSEREWQVPPEEGARQFDIAGIDYNPDAQFWICESMLEMD